MKYRPLYLTDITDYNTDKKLEYALLKKEITSSIPPHRHSFLEISFVLEGRGIEVINGKMHMLEPGSFSLLLPYHVHEIKTDTAQPLVQYNLALSPDSIFSDNTGSGIRDILFAREGQLDAFFKLDDDVSQKVASIFAGMLEQCFTGGRWDILLFKAMLTEILVFYCRSCVNSAEKLTSTLDSEDETFWSIVRYIYENFSEPISLTFLEHHFHIRSNKISKLFKGKTCENFNHFLEHLRIEHACRLLSSTNMSVMDISLETGFESYITFSRAFRANTGTSAVKYRKSKVSTMSNC